MDFDEYEYLENTVENPEQKKLEGKVNGGDGTVKPEERNRSRRLKHRNDDYDRDDLGHPSKRSRSGKEFSDRDKDRGSRQGSSSRDRERADKDRSSRELRNKDKEEGSGKERDRNRERDRDREGERDREKGRNRDRRERDHVYEGGTDREGERERSRQSKSHLERHLDEQEKERSKDRDKSADKDYKEKRGEMEFRDRDRDGSNRRWRNLMVTKPRLAEQAWALLTRCVMEVDGVATLPLDLDEEDHIEKVCIQSILDQGGRSVLGGVLNGGAPMY